MSRFLPAESCPDLGNNEHNSKINAYNSVKTAKHVAFWSFCNNESVCLAAHPDAQMFLGLLWPVKTLCTGPGFVCEGLANWAQTP